MSWLTMKQAATMMGGELRGGDAPFERISTDTRAPAANALFFALKGPRFDAHEVLDAQPDTPFAGVVVERPVGHDAPSVAVGDTRLALGKFAGAVRAAFAGRVVGVTGSNGKTTVKQMLATILERQALTLATRGNLNNDIGVPLTLSRLRAGHRFAVIEMGANHPGEIEYLSGLARPDVAIITNAGAAHLEGFGDVAGVADAKAEIFSGMSAEGVAIINLDDEFADRWLAMNRQRRVFTFGEASGADVRIVGDQPLALRVFGKRREIPLALPGRHNAMNAAAAVAACLALDIDMSEIAAGLAQVKPVAGRLQFLVGVGGATVIDDSYNANPDSVRAAIALLSERAGKRYLVLGDLAELGVDAAERHAALGRLAREAGIDALLTIGELAHRASERFGSGGEHFASPEALVEALAPRLGADDAVLVKGSRAARMERVVNALTQNGEARHAV